MSHDEAGLHNIGLDAMCVFSALKAETKILCNRDQHATQSRDHTCCFILQQILHVFLFVLVVVVVVSISMLHVKIGRGEYNTLVGLQKTIQGICEAVKRCVIVETTLQSLLHAGPRTQLVCVSLSLSLLC